MMMIRYRMLFLNPKTFLTAAVSALALLPAGLMLTVLAGQVTIFTAVSVLLTWLLCGGLILAWRREDMIRVSGLVAGMLLTELCRYTYLSERYLSIGVDSIVALGLAACMRLSAYLMVCFIILMVTYNHFTIFLGRNSGRTKLIVNQISICVLLLCFLALTVLNWMMGGGPVQQAAGVIECLADLCLFTAVACCELYLAVDGQALARGR